MYGACQDRAAPACNHRPAGLLEEGKVAALLCHFTTLTYARTQARTLSHTSTHSKVQHVSRIVAKTHQVQLEQAKLKQMIIESDLGGATDDSSRSNTTGTPRSYGSGSPMVVPSGMSMKGAVCTPHSPVCPNSPPILIFYHIEYLSY